MNIQYFFGQFPIIEIGNIVLREIVMEDAEDYYNYMSRKEMDGFLTQDNRPETVEKSVEELKYWSSLFPNKRSIYWAIAKKSDNKMIGTAGFNIISFPHSRAEISYDLDPKCWGQGIMLRSIKAILKFADHDLGLVRVQATVITDNKRSIKLLERCGFKKEGVLAKYEVVDGVHKDYFMYGRVN